MISTSQGLSSMVGLTVADIISQYGDDYEVECLEGRMAFYYEDCPYIFYYSTIDYDSDWKPNSDDTIFGVETSDRRNKKYIEKNKYRMFVGYRRNIFRFQIEI